jgi:phospholipid/cholesterol/gamma-HCH transport system substrate-binding protein
MRNERKAEIKVGITTIISLIIFIWIMGWSRNFIRTSGDAEINIVFDNVSGLELDDDVTIRGLRKGFVKDIILDRNIIIVKISIDESVDLRKDAVFWLATVDLMGGKKIEIIPGITNEKLNFDILHRGEFLSDFSTMMQTIGSAKNDLLTIVDDIKTSLNSVKSFLTDEEMKTDLRSSLKNLNVLTYKLDVMLGENRENISTIVENTAEISEDAKVFMDENKENLSVSVSKLKSLLNKSDSLVNQFNYITTQTIEEENNLGKVLYDDSLFVKITETFNLLNQISKMILYQLQRNGLKVDANIW